MTTTPSPNPSFQDTLMELYNGNKEDSIESTVVVHGNGSPFALPPPSKILSLGASSSGQPNPKLFPGKAASTSGIKLNGGNSNNNIAQQSKISPRGSSKKKLGRNYHFIPMIGKKNHRHLDEGSDDDSDNSDNDGYYGNHNWKGFYEKNDGQQSSSNNGVGEANLNNGNDRDGSSNMSDQDVLRDIFTTSVAFSTDDNSQDENDKDGGCNGHVDERERGNRNLKGGANDGNSKMNGPLHLKGNEQPFTSRLGQRIWQQYQEQQQKQSHPKSIDQGLQQPDQPSSPTTARMVSFRHLPTPDFLRLPPTTTVQIWDSSSNKTQWVNIEELERKVMQQHLDLEAIEPTESPLMKDEHDVTRQSSNLSSSLLTSECFTKVVERDAQVGLGMSLRAYDGSVYIQALLRRDGSRIEGGGGTMREEQNSTAAGPTCRAGLLPGDRLLGLNGQSFLKGRLATIDGVASTTNGSSHHSKTHASSEDVLKSMGDAISTAKSPMAFHIQRIADRESILTILRKLQTEGRDKVVEINGPYSQTPTADNNALHAAEKSSQLTTVTRPKGPIIHPFAKALAERSLIKKGKEELIVTRQLRIFTDRARQWESKLSFRLRASDFTLRPLLDARDVEPSYYASFLTDDGELPPLFDYKFSKSIRSYAPSTPMIQDWRLSHPSGHMASPPSRVNNQLPKEAAIMADLYAGLDEDDASVQDLILGSKSSSASDGEVGAAYPSSLMQAMSDPSDIFVPLMGVRKAICVRILNSFLDNRNRTAFTLWCYDAEQNMEWYAPVRYYNDFKDLRSALMRVDKTVADIPFPSLGWSLGFSSEVKESAKTKEARRSQLEVFLRRVFAGVYRGRLHPYLAEVAVHLQTFVGCDTVLNDGGDSSSLSLSKQVAISESSYNKRTPDPKSEPDNNARMHLKRSIMRYVYRLFLLPSFEELISQFIDAARDKVMSEVVGPSTRRPSHQFEVDKGTATKDVEKIRDFIDQVQELILEGCHDDFISMSQRRDFAALVDDYDNTIRDDLFREAVREQTELEVYVPLRSTISKYLVYAWFNEDMEMKHKMKALANKPQSYFRIPKEHRSRSDWKSVSNILKEGVGRSTLPCVKLRAVVDAAKEISQLDSEERSIFPDASFFDAKVVTKAKTLGADDFLPIFIFCFVQAKIERPSALCELLSLMCDPKKVNGEAGYYLASFHAALTHIHELDLTEAENDLSIIFDT